MVSQDCVPDDQLELAFLVSSRCLLLEVPLEALAPLHVGAVHRGVQVGSHYCPQQHNHPQTEAARIKPALKMLSG